MATVDIENLFERERSHQGWARYLARSIDALLILPAIFVAMFGLGIAIEMGRAPAEILVWLDNWFGAIAIQVVFLLLLSSVWEPVFLSTIGATPGKWIMGVRVRDAEGRKLGFLKALQRTWMAVILGMGLGIPLVSLIAMLIARADLNTEGATSWDRMLETQVSHRERPLIVWILMFVFVFGANAALQVLSRAG